MPKLGCLNIHGSLLPRWRGAAPIHRALIAGDTETGVTIMLMNEGLDTGDMITKVVEPIGPNDTTPMLHDRLAALGAKALVDVLSPWCAKDIEATPQPLEGVSYADKLQKSEGVIDFSKSAVDCDRRIRGLAGWPIAESTLNGDRIRIHGSELSTVTVPSSAKPGTVIEAGKDGVIVATGKGALALTRLQRPGKPALDAADFTSGLTLTGSVFGG